MNQTNTSGGAFVGGNVDTNEFVGRDKTINNIIIVGRFLEFAQIERLLPKLKHEQNFTSIAQAIESSLVGKLDSDLADAIAWAGEVLGEFLNKWAIKDEDSPVPLPIIASQLVNHVGFALYKAGYWNAYEMKFGSYSGLRLVVTEMLYINNHAHLYCKGWEKTFLMQKVHASEYELGLYEYGVYTAKFREFDTSELRTIIAGIILDLIRIKSDNTISVQFLKELADMVKPKDINTMSK